MAYMIPDEVKSELEVLGKRYPRKEALLLPALKILQKKHGWISEDALEALSEYLGLPYARVKGVMTFYSMFDRVPAGKYHLQICRNLTCHLMGAKDLRKHLEESLKIKAGETTPDGLFTLSESECLGSCDTGPVISVDGEFHGNMTPEKVDRLLEGLREARTEGGGL